LNELSHNLKETLQESLNSYYFSISQGDLVKLSTLMTQESYLIVLTTLGFKKAFRDKDFEHLLEEIGDNPKSLSEVQNLLSQDLREESRQYAVEVRSYENKGTQRITLHYTENGQLKKMYFSLQDTQWKIDFKAGRAKDF
jgi:hypothetical protein